MSIENIIKKWTNPQEVLLRAGEMEEQELRTAMAVLNAFAREIEKEYQSQPKGKSEMHSVIFFKKVHGKNGASFVIKKRINIPFDPRLDVSFGFEKNSRKQQFESHPKHVIYNVIRDVFIVTLEDENDSDAKENLLEYELKNGWICNLEIDFDHGDPCGVEIAFKSAEPDEQVIRLNRRSNPTGCEDNSGLFIVNQNELWLVENDGSDYEILDSSDLV